MNKKLRFLLTAAAISTLLWAPPTEPVDAADSSASPAEPAGAVDSPAAPAEPVSAVDSPASPAEPGGAADSPVSPAEPAGAVNASASLTQITAEISGPVEDEAENPRPGQLAAEVSTTAEVQVQPKAADLVDQPPTKDGTPGSAEFSGGNLSLNFQDIEVRAVLQLIADFTGLNLVASDTVTGRITLQLDDVPWQQALALVLRMRGLDQRLEGDVLLVAPAEEIAARERLALENQRQLAELAPLASEFIQVHYANAADLLALFTDPDGEGSILSERGSVIVDERTNSAILTDTPANIEAFRRVIRQLDVPVRQVLIESRIVTTSNDFSEQLGIRWGGAAVKNNGSSEFRFGGSLGTLGELHDSAASPEGRIETSSPDNLIVDLGVSRSGTSSFGVGITGQGYLVDLEISALAAEGFAEVVARPQIVTADKSPAVIESGVEIPYQEATSSGATSTAFKDAVLSLKVTPQITANDRIVMELDVKQDTVGQIFNGIPSVNTNQISTKVLVDNGQTVVLGGIFQTIKNFSTDKTPLLGDVPHLGRLFRRTSERDKEEELLVFITPSIVREASARPGTFKPD